MMNWDCQTEEWIPLAPHNTRPLRVGILGARNIGKVHARILKELDANVCCVLGSTVESAALAATELKEAFDVEAEPFSRLDDLLLQASPDAVTIATPPELHFDQVMQVLDMGIFALCEKPLFWQKNVTVDEVVRRLGCLRSHPHRRLFVNTSNAYLLEAVQSRLPNSDSIDSFYFQFHTQGRHQDKDIAVDLLPHGLSMLLQALGQREITDFSNKITQTTYECSFNYGRCKVRFDFQQQYNGERKLLFAVNNREFLRIQRSGTPTFQISLRDSESGDDIQVDDPFRVYISRFLDFCRTTKGEASDTFETSAANMEMMARMVL